MIIGIPIPFDTKRYYLNSHYAKWIKNAGYEISLIMPDNTLEKYQYDGFIIPGGSDIDPTLFNEKNISSFNCMPQLDMFQMRILTYSIEHKIPVFGVCRGHQLIYKYLKNKYPNDILFSNMIYEQDIRGHDTIKYYEKLSHNVMIVESNSFLDVNSLHHQGFFVNKTQFFLKTIGQVTHISEYKYKPDFYLVEGMYYNVEGCRMKSVQWHPEGLNQIDLLQNFFI